MKKTNDIEVPSSRLIFATVLFILSLASAAFIPLVLWLPISDAAKKTISALLVVGVPQGLNILAVIILGKKGYQYLKSLVFEFIKKNVKFREIGPFRHTIGLIMFIIPLVLAWLLPYFSENISFYQPNKILINAGGDILFIASLVVLGGDFWDKLRGLFFRNAKMNFPPKQLS